jgi:hypothetical protein
MESTLPLSFRFADFEGTTNSRRRSPASPRFTDLPGHADRESLDCLYSEGSQLTSVAKEWQPFSLTVCFTAGTS